MNSFLLFLVDLILPALIVKQAVLVEKTFPNKQSSQTFTSEFDLFSLHIFSSDGTVVKPNITPLDFILQSTLLKKVDVSLERKIIYYQFDNFDATLIINASYYEFLHKKLLLKETGKNNFAFNLLTNIDKLFPTFADTINSLNDIDLSHFIFELVKNNMITEDMLRAIIVHLKEAGNRVYSSLPGSMKDSLKKEATTGLKLNRYWIGQSLFISQLNSYTLFLGGKLKSSFLPIHKSILFIYYSSVVSQAEFRELLLKIETRGKLQLALSQGKSSDWINVINFLGDKELLMIERSSSKRNFRDLVKGGKINSVTAIEFVSSAYNLIRLFVELNDNDEGDSQQSLDDLVFHLDSTKVFNWILWEMGLVNFVSALKTLRQQNLKLVLDNMTPVARTVLRDIIDLKITLLNNNREVGNKKAASELKIHLLFFKELGIVTI